jgi:hypothetical protein
MDLSEERKKDSFYYTCVVYNSGLSETRVNPDDISSMSRSFATIMRQRVTADNTFYERADKPRLGTDDGLDNNLKALADWQFFDYDFNDLNAPWNQYQVAEDAFKPPSLITEIQDISNPMADVQVASLVSNMMKDLNRRRLEDLMTEILEANGVNFKGGDSITLSFNGRGGLSLVFDKTIIGGADNMNKFLVSISEPSVVIDKSQVSSILAAEEEADKKLAEEQLRFSTLMNISSALNTAKTPSGKSLNTALSEQFLLDKAGAARNDASRPISFSFQYNADTDRSEIGKVQSSSSDTEEKTKYVYVNHGAVADVMNTILQKHFSELGITEECKTFQRINDDGTITFSRERSWIHGADAAKMDELFTEIEAAIDRSGCIYMFESSKPVRCNGRETNVLKWEDSQLQTGWRGGNCGYTADSQGVIIDLTHDAYREDHPDSTLTSQEYTDKWFAEYTAYVAEYYTNRASSSK